jgi:hypothetical protein
LTVSASLLRAFRICEAATLVDVFSKACGGVMLAAAYRRVAVQSRGVWWFVHNGQLIGLKVIRVVSRASTEVAHQPRRLQADGHTRHLPRVRRNCVQATVDNRLRGPDRAGVPAKQVGRLLGVLKIATLSSYADRGAEGWRHARAQREIRRHVCDGDEPSQGATRRDKEWTYDVGLRLAVMALRVEAAIILASGRGRLEVRRNCARCHCDCVMWVEIGREDAKSSSVAGGVVVLKEQDNQVCVGAV